MIDLAVDEPVLFNEAERIQIVLETYSKSKAVLSGFQLFYKRNFPKLTLKDTLDFPQDKILVFSAPDPNVIVADMILDV